MNENPSSAAAGIIFIAAAILIMSCLQGCASGRDNAAAAADRGAPSALSNQRGTSRASSPAATQHGKAQEGVMGITGHAIGDMITLPLSVFNGNSG
jgi:hypothetical protein